MSIDDINKWNQKYRNINSDGPADPDAELARYQHLLPRQGLALDLACGTGKNALFLAKTGLNVVALDGAGEALNKLNAYSNSQGLQDKIECIEADIDSYALTPERFEMIVVARFLERRLFASIQASLKPGGILFYKTFNKNMLLQSPGFNKAYTIETLELIAEFGGLQVLAENSTEQNSTQSFILASKPTSTQREPQGNGSYSD